MEHFDGKTSSRREKREVEEEVEEFCPEINRRKIAYWSLSNTVVTIIFLLILAISSRGENLKHNETLFLLVFVFAFLFSTLATLQIKKIAKKISDNNGSLNFVGADYFFQGTAFCAIFWLVIILFILKTWS